MSKNKFTCKQCDSPIPAKLVKKYNFNVCPVCGHLYPKCIEDIRQYFRIIQLSEELEKARNLILKGEMIAAVRDAVVVLEMLVKELSGLSDLIGSDLMAKAFSFKIDSQTKQLTEKPRISINDLSTVLKINEQEGIKFVAMGLMQGVRNIFMHSKGTEKLFYCIQVITIVDFLLKQIIGWGAIAK